MQRDLSGRRALVCGASQGIGLETARALASRGAHVVLLARREAPLEALAARIVEEGGSADVCVADLDHLDIQGIPADLHIVIHNTGGPPGGPLAAASVHALEASFHRHVGSAQAILQHVLPFMTAEGWGRWVNVLSTSVYEPIDNLGVSNLTRAAMASWAKTLSRELPPGVTINNVLPGFTDTERLTALAAGRAEKSGQTEEAVRESWIAQVPEGRLADPTETAAMIAFLASPDGAYVRGQSIAVDGGRLRGI
ncbi:MAG: SDR family oxidoreductase [Alphaproteobacteria bacterium]|nr:SDR family oxidoreductase [Alphaproteobacteria bacterium]